MPAQESTRRKERLTPLTVLIAGAVAIAVTVSVTLRTYLPLFISDYEQIFMRAVQLKHGEIGIADFVFRRQVDHPHVIVFGLAYLDVEFLQGRAWLLWAAEIAFSVATIVTIARSIYRTDIGKGARFALIGVSLFLLSGPQNVGVLQWPFLVTLIGTASLVAMASYFLVRERSLPVVAWLMFAVAIIGHGAGILVLPVIAAFFALTRQKQYGLIAILLAIEFAIYSHYYPATPNIRLSAILEKMVRAPRDWVGIPISLAFLLGRGLTSGLFGPKFDVFVGAFGLATYAVALIAFLRERKAPHMAFLSTFGLLACLTSITLNIAYEDLRRANVVLEYFFSNRYLPWIAFFWIGTLIGAAASNTAACKAATPVSAILVALLCVASVPLIQQANADYRVRLTIINNFGCRYRIPDAVLAAGVGLPTNYARRWSNLVFEWQREVGAIHISHPDACAIEATSQFQRNTMLDRIINIKAANFSDVNWSNGISRTDTGFFVDNPEIVVSVSPSDVVRFADGSVRRITRIDGRNIYLEGKPLPASVGYPATIQIIRH